MTSDKSTRLTEAFALASELHADQHRKGTEIPYLSHLLAVAALVMEHGGSRDQVIAALLHDGPEDQGGEATLAIIRERFGETVGRIVAECSDTFEDPKPPWRPRKERYIEHLRAEASPETLLVSLADKTHNLGSILRDFETHGDQIWDRFKADVDGMRWYYGSLLAVYEDRVGSEAVGPLLREYGRLVERLQRI